MKKRFISILTVFTLVLVICVGCTSETGTNITMPFSSEEYVDGEWTSEDLKEHFQDLGFSQIETFGNTTIIIGVYIENDDAEYDSFEKGENIDCSRKICIYTESRPLNVDNSPELAEIINNGIESPENNQAWQEFLEIHNEEQFEFDGTITDWYDEVFWCGVSFTIAIEDSEYMSFSKNSVDLIDLDMTDDYNYNKYHAGLISEGMRVHVITDIVQSENGWQLEIDSMQVIE